VFDAGCGWGRNLVYLMRAGFEVFGADGDADAVAEVRSLARQLAPALPVETSRVEPLERMTFPDGLATVVISSAVLHCQRRGAVRRHAEGDVAAARARRHVLLPARLVDWIRGSHPSLEPGNRLCVLPDGTRRYVVDEALLMRCTHELGGKLLDPIKTTVCRISGR
jgi:SAM-dependent methyltransferase